MKYNNIPVLMCPSIKHIKISHVEIIPLVNNVPSNIIRPLEVSEPIEQYDITFENENEYDNLFEDDLYEF